MKKLIVIGLFLTLALVAVSTPALAAIEVEGDAYVGYYDKYLWRGFRPEWWNPCCARWGGLECQGLYSELLD